MTIRAGSSSDQIRSGFFPAVGSRTLIVSLCVLLAAACLSPSVKAQQPTIGYVTHIEGEWYLDGQRGKTLSRGDALPASGVIRIPKPSRYASIAIRYADNSQTIVRQCRNAGECEGPILLPRAVQRQASYRERFVAKFFGWFGRNPVSPSSQAGRSADGTLREAVVQIKSGEVDLAPVFADMNYGTYDVRLQRRMSDGKMTDVAAAKPTRIKWDAGTVNTTPELTLPPGLYEMVLLERRGSEYKSTLTTAWFLAGNLEQYAQTVAPFCEATQLTATWKDDVIEGTARDFLRSFLIHLESESQPAQPAK